MTAATIQPMTVSADEKVQAEVFPVLTPAQIARVQSHGRRRRIAVDEVLAQPGDPVTRMWVVLSGQLVVITSTRRPGDTPPGGGLTTKNGIASAGGAKSAWFKDTDGNMLAIVQKLR